ncbi:MAG: Ger(x)C family spore germination protein [Eubacteriaceae bacterium]|nr:Ger(x)C family spore germination protein [Eubacteriaceae bacterium]
MNKRKIKKFFVFALILLFVVPMFGCWDYVTLPDTGVVLAMAVDKDPATNNYKLAFDIIDMKNSSKDKGIKDIIVESEGVTIFDAIRNAKRKLAVKVFFGNMEVIVVSDELARTEGIMNIVEFMIRDQEPRETLNILISQEKTAKELLLLQGITNMSGSELHEIVHEDRKVTAKTENVELFEIFNMLEGKNQQLALPAFHKVKADDKETFESNGCAIFKEDKLIGYLSPDDTFYYLMITDKLQGGIMNLQVQKDRLTAFEIYKSKTKLSYEYDKKTDKFKMIIGIEIFASIHDFPGQNELIDENNIKNMQEAAQKGITDNIKRVVSEIQNNYDSDIFGFGELIYRKNPKLWKNISKDWDKYFKNLEVEVKPHVQIKETGLVGK